MKTVLENRKSIKIFFSFSGKRGALCFFVILTIVDCLRCKTIITKDVSEGSLYSVTKVHAIIRLICFGIYFLSLIPVGDDSDSHYEELLTNEVLNERYVLWKIVLWRVQGKGTKVEKVFPRFEQS